jgi:hypothetical protein
VDWRTPAIVSFLRNVAGALSPGYRVVAHVHRPALLPTLRTGTIYGVLFTVLCASAGFVLAGDSGQSNTGGTLQGGVSATAVKVYSFELLNITSAKAIGKQIDVLTTAYFTATVFAPNGWKNVTGLYVDLWYTNDSAAMTYAGQTTGKNYRGNLSYTNAGLSSPTLAQWTNNSAVGNLDYILGSSSTTTNSAGFNYTFKIAFQFHAQMHHALGVTPSTSGYVGAKTWDAQFLATDSNGDLTSQATNSTGDFLQFGIFEHTSVSLSTSTWTATGIAPGASKTTNIVTVTYASNGNYSMNITLEKLLTNIAGDTIPAVDVSVTGGAASGLTYGAPPSTNYIFGGASSFALQAANADALSVTISFTITVPIGTPVGVYSAPLVLTLTESGTP